MIAFDSSANSNTTTWSTINALYEVWDYGNGDSNYAVTQKATVLSFILFFISLARFCRGFLQVCHRGRRSSDRAMKAELRLHCWGLSFYADGMVPGRYHEGIVCGSGYVLFWETPAQMDWTEFAAEIWKLIGTQKDGPINFSSVPYWNCRQEIKVSSKFLSAEG